jgi:hypothetical protein
LDRLIGFEDVQQYIGYLGQMSGSVVIQHEGNTPRLRTLAPSGLYQGHFDYRRELHGHVLYTSRCRLCLEVQSAQGAVIQPQTKWQSIGGLILYNNYLKQLTIDDADIDQVKDLWNVMAYQCCHDSALYTRLHSVWAQLEGQQSVRDVGPIGQQP